MSKTDDLFGQRTLKLIACDGLPDPDLIAGHSPVGIKTSSRAHYAALRSSLAASEATIWLTSELHRAQQTAARVFPNTKWTEDPFLIDRSAGDWDGLTWRQVRDSDPVACEAYWNAPGRSQAPQGETLTEVRHRVVHFLSSVANQAGHEHVIAMAHPDILRVALTHIMNGSLSHAFRVEIKPLACLHLVNSWSGWRLLALNQM